VRFLVDEGSRPGARYFMEKKMLMVIKMMGTKRGSGIKYW